MDPGSPGRTRTADPVVNSHLLCQLSYWGSRDEITSEYDIEIIKNKGKIVNMKGTEGMTASWRQGVTAYAGMPANVLQGG